MLEIGLSSEGKCGVVTFGMGKMDANFHCFRTTDEDSDRFIISDNGAAKNGAPIRKNQAGILSNPVDV